MSLRRRGFASFALCVFLLWGTGSPGTAAAAPPPLPEGGAYRIVARESTVKARVRSTLHDFDVDVKVSKGELVLPPPGEKVSIRLRLEFPAKEMDSDNFLRNLVMRGEVFEAEAYPLAVFEAGEAAYQGAAEKGGLRFRLRGSLTLHGVTRALSIPVTVTAGGGRLAAAAAFEIRVTDHKMTIPSPLPFLKTEEVVAVRVRFVFRKQGE